MSTDIFPAGHTVSESTVMTGLHGFPTQVSVIRADETKPVLIDPLAIMTKVSSVPMYLLQYHLLHPRAGIRRYLPDEVMSDLLGSVVNALFTYGREEGSRFTITIRNNAPGWPCFVGLTITVGANDRCSITTVVSYDTDIANKLNQTSPWGAADQSWLTDKPTQGEHHAPRY